MDNRELVNFSLAYLDSRVSSFRYLVSERTLSVLNQIALSEQILGVTDTFSLSLLAMLTHLCQPTRFLQLGTHYGYAALVLADVMKHNFRPGHLYTVELNEECHRYARQKAEAAGLIDVIDFIDGSSIERPVVDIARAKGPYEMVYIDSSHAYRETLTELEYYVADNSIVSPTSFVLFHDATEFAKQYDPTNSGGVRKALVEWRAKHRQDFQLFLFEPPTWPNACGLALISGRPADFDSDASRPERGRQKTIMEKVRKILS